MPVPESHGLLSKSLLRDEAYAALRDAIVNGTLVPGERLYDADLTRWLGLSRTPIREALARLERAGLVQTKPGRYTMVSPLDVRKARAAQAVAATLHQLAAREAVPNMSTADIDTMREANDRFRRAIDAEDADAALRADDDFHAVAVAGSANPVISAVLEQVTAVLRRLERLRFTSLDGRGSIVLHNQIIALCEQGDADGAASAAHENWQTLLPLLEFDGNGDDREQQAD